MVIFHSYVSHYQRVIEKITWSFPTCQVRFAEFCVRSSVPLLLSSDLSGYVWRYVTIYSCLVVEPYPSEKYESHLGWLFPIYGKIDVPNHQPVYDECQRNSQVFEHVNQLYSPVTTIFVLLPTQILSTWNGDIQNIMIYQVGYLNPWRCLQLPISVASSCFKALQSFLHDIVVG